MSGDTCIVSFSAGKDSVVAALRLREMFPRLVLFYLYLVPGLEFVEQGLRYYEDFFGTPILRLPHPSLPRMLENFVYQPPDRVRALQATPMPRLSYEQVEAHVRRVAGAPDAYVAIGTRTADSPIRLANVRRYGSANHTRRSFFAVYDWKIADVECCLHTERCKLPVDYELFGRSFDGIDYRFLAPIKERFPRDYAKILEWFPLAHLDIQRREYAARRTHAA
jgi:3'-phosphoadenosine 5'-phosphosulfate sulfotransferase (PAPS reductase)/FAD synthetase